MNSKIIVYHNEMIENYNKITQLCLMMNIEIILINDQMLQNKIKDILNKKIKKSKNKKINHAVVIFSNINTKQMDRILDLLKDNLQLCLKAIVTATNYQWSFDKLDQHLMEEYQKSN